MNRITEKKRFSDEVVCFRIEAPEAASAAPGQFVILRLSEKGERFPLTVAGCDREKGLITVVVQEVGKSTRALGAMKEGDCILDIAGPLGNPTHLDGVRRACVIGGGLGAAIAYPQASYLHGAGADVDMIAGFRTEKLVFFEEELRAASSRLFVCTDDGSNGNRGFVTAELRRLLEGGEKYDVVICSGPLPMMRAVCAVTKGYDLKTVVSMNTIMLDGTGMCGCCRLTVGGETKFACVDGPDFDGHLVDFDEAIMRNAAFRDIERRKDHACKLEGMSNG